jgi:tetratricopeptide (TPR) repeat protein
MDCKRIECDELIEKYLTGKLDKSEQTPFESHIFACPPCLEKMQVYRMIQEELWETAEAAHPALTKAYRPRTWRWAFAAGASALLVLAIIAFLWRTGGFGRTSTGPSTKRPALELLARFDPPPYLPPVLRGGADEAAEKFRTGMSFYQKSDYVRAIRDLQSAAALDPQAAHIRFFLGVCFLLAERTDAGIDELKEVIAFGDSAYLAESHFYLAKGFLRKGDTSRAKAELKILAESGGTLKDEAIRLLNSLD